MSKGSMLGLSLKEGEERFLEIGCSELADLELFQIYTQSKFLSSNSGSKVISTLLMSVSAHFCSVSHRSVRRLGN